MEELKIKLAKFYKNEPNNGNLLVFKLLLVCGCSFLTRSLEEKAHAEGRISLCQHICNPFVCACV